MSRPDEPVSQHPQIGIGVAALRGGFNAAVSVPRLVFLVSPTCDVCVSGARAAAQAVLSLPAACDFRLYIVWLPVLANDSLQAAEGARLSLSQDARLAHFWDHDLIISRTYHQVLQLGQRQRRHRVAWDIFLLYRAGPLWGDVPPVPSFWMHQLFLEDVPKLEPDSLRHELDQMIHGNKHREDESATSYQEVRNRPPEKLDHQHRAV
jgi:hypothetical protein